MFWGLIMESNKRYSQTVKKAFHISMAALDEFSSNDEKVQVMCIFENRKYLLCTLQKDVQVQTPLDLNFDVGDVISFVTNGKANVHLTGYLADDPLDDFEESDEDDEFEIEKVETLGKINPKNIVSSKRPIKPPTEKTAPPSKKSKTLKLLEDVNSQDDDDSDDSDVVFSDVNTDDDSTLNLDLEDDSEDDDDGDEDDEDEDDEDELEEVNDEEADEVDSDLSDSLGSEEEEEELNVKQTKKTKVNGTTNKKGKTESPLKKETPNKVTPNKATPKSVHKEKKVLQGGVSIEDTVVGDGRIAKPGKMVQVYYEGRLKGSNKVFDSSLKGSGFKFRLGKQEVIKAWDIGVVGMKIGGKRKIICPPGMAYGEKGSPPAVPPNSTLVFEVELKNVN